MNLLLDTHILLWWLADDPHLSARARQWIAQDAESVFVSVISMWEISIKLAQGKVRVDLKAVHRQIEHGDYIYLPLEPAHVLSLSHLPAHHADPFDRILLAQATSERLSFLTCDASLQRYGDAVLIG